MKIIKAILILTILVLYSRNNLVAQATYDSAIKKFKNEKWNESIAEIRQLHLEGGNTFESHALCGFAYNQLGIFESASNHFFQAQKFKPNDPNIQAVLIRLHINYNKYKLALDLSNSSLEKFPTNREIQFLHATSLFLNGKPKIALKKVEKLKSDSPDDPEILNLEGRIYFDLNNFEKSELSLKWAMALKKDSPYIWNNLALVQEKLYLFYNHIGNKNNALSYLKEAKESIQYAISLDAKNQSIATNAGRILSY